MGTEALAGLFAAITVVILVLAKVIEYFIGKRSGSGGPQGLTSSERQSLFRIEQIVCRLKEQHDRVDEDGTPMWYVPRSLSKQNERIIEIQGKTVVILDKLTDKMNEHDVRMNERDERMIQLLDKINEKVSR